MKFHRVSLSLPFFPHPLLSVILVKTARLKNFNSSTDLIPPWWWHFPIYIIFLILVIMFCCIKLRFSNSSDDFRICQKMCFWSNKVFICIYIAIKFKINWRFTSVLKFFKLCFKQLKQVIDIRLASCLALRTYAGFPEAVYQCYWWDVFPSCR